MGTGGERGCIPWSSSIGKYRLWPTPKATWGAFLKMACWPPINGLLTITLHRKKRKFDRGASICYNMCTVQSSRYKDHMLKYGGFQWYSNLRKAWCWHFHVLASRWLVLLGEPWPILRTWYSNRDQKSSTKQIWKPLASLLEKQS